MYVTHYYARRILTTLSIIFCTRDNKFRLRRMPSSFIIPANRFQLLPVALHKIRSFRAKRSVKVTRYRYNITRYGRFLCVRNFIVF